MSRAGMPPRRRRRLLVVPVCLALLAAGTKVATMYAFAAVGSDAYDGGRYDASESSFRRLETLNVVDPSLALVGLGDARHRQGDLLGAEDAFAAALDEATGDCEIRFNLTVTIEAQGDLLVAGEALTPEAGGPFDPGIVRADPIERYSLALDVVDAGECPSAEADGAGARLADTRERIAAKLAALEGASTEDEREDPESPTQSDRGDSEQIDNLDLRNQSGATQREEARDQDTSGAAPGGQSNW